MKGKGLRSERETVIIFNEAEDTASIWTASGVIYRKLKKLGYSPTEDNDRSASFEVPKKCVSIRKLKALSENQRAVLRERGRKLHQNIPTLPILPKQLP